MRENRGYFFLCSPYWLWTNTDQCSGNDPLSSPLEARISARPFAPLQRMSSFENRRGKIDAPGLYLRLQLWTFPQARSVWNSTPLPLFRGLGRIHAPDPLPDSKSTALRRSPISAPLWDFSIPPAQSALPVTESERAYLSRQPDLPSLPDSANYH